MTRCCVCRKGRFCRGLMRTCEFAIFCFLYFWVVQCTINLEKLVYSSAQSEEEKEDPFKQKSGWAEFGLSQAPIKETAVERGLQQQNDWKKIPLRLGETPLCWPWCSEGQHYVLKSLLVLPGESPTAAIRHWQELHGASQAHKELLSSCLWVWGQ